MEARSALVEADLAGIGWTSAHGYWVVSDTDDHPVPTPGLFPPIVLRDLFYLAVNRELGRDPSYLCYALIHHDVAPS